MQDDLERVLFHEPEINRRLDELAAQISNDYRDRELTVIAVLSGSFMFMADLLRRVPLPIKLDDGQEPGIGTDLPLVRLDNDGGLWEKTERKLISTLLRHTRPPCSGLTVLCKSN